ncbi:hypothetical protein [Streptomyces sp. NPDC001744]
MFSTWEGAAHHAAPSRTNTALRFEHQEEYQAPPNGSNDKLIP